MKALALFAFVSVSAACSAATIGETFDQLIAERGKPKSQMNAGNMRVVTYADVSIKLRDDIVISITPIVAPKPTPTPATPESPLEAAAPVKDAKGAPMSAATAEAALKRAIEAVERIVNQPVESVPITPQIKASKFSPGWFHDGAITPDFPNVDVRKSQEFPYAKYEYVTSDLNPGVAFLGKDLEFNSMTKLFYTDRKLPKKKLDEREMLEINQQYRLIAQYRKIIQDTKAAQ